MGNSLNDRGEGKMKRKALSIIVLLIVLPMSSMFLWVTSQVKAQTYEWSEPQQLTTDPAQDQYASIMQDSTGKIWLVWERAGNLLCKTSSDGGTSWSTPEILVTDILIHVGTSLLQDSTGRIWVAWGCVRHSSMGGDIFYITSDDGGLSWSAPQQLTDYPYDDVTPSLIEVSGEVWIVFRSYGLSYNADIWYVKTNDGGATWSTPIQLTSYSGREFTPSAMVDSTGKIWVAWCRELVSGNENIYYKTSIDKGASWSPDQELTTHPNDEGHPSIIEDVSGTIFVFYALDEGTVVNIYYRTTADSGNTWSAPDLLTINTCNDGVPYAALIKNQVWVIWQSDRSGNSDIWMSRIAPIPAAIDIDPDTLNLKSNGEWITAYIELPEGYDVSDIEVNSIQVNDAIPIDVEAPATVGDYDLDSVPDLMVKFDRASIIELLDANDYSEDTGKSCFATLTITGTVLDTTFEGSDTIKVLRK